MVYACDLLSNTRRPRFADGERWAVVSEDGAIDGFGRSPTSVLPMTELGPGSGGAKRQKSSTALTAIRTMSVSSWGAQRLSVDELYEFWQTEVWLLPVPHLFVPACPFSV